MQRDELLQRLGSLPGETSTAPPPKPPPPQSAKPAKSIPAVTEPVENVVPKPAASEAAQQFRKLRRDAKRKALGV
jgi:hypothetical protein